jgi:hypothetical protein
VQTPGGGEFQALADCKEHNAANTLQISAQITHDVFLGVRGRVRVFESGDMSPHSTISLSAARGIRSAFERLL